MTITGRSKSTGQIDTHRFVEWFSPLPRGRHAIDAPGKKAPVRALMPDYKPAGEARHGVAANRVGVAAIAAKLRSEQPSVRDLADQLTSGLLEGDR